MKYILAIFICIFCINQGLSSQGFCAGMQTERNLSYSNSGLVDTNKLKNEINAILKRSLQGAEVLSFRQIPKNGTVVYECDVSYQDNVIKLYVNPQNGAVSGKLDDKALFLEKITQTKINKGTKEVNNILRQIKLDASFSDVTYNKKDKTMEGNIIYMDNRYYFKLNVATGEIIDMRPLD